MKKIALFLIKLYKKLISPSLPSVCRFYPSCSTYCYQAIEKYGPWKGLWITLKRVIRCNPFSDGGFDPLK